MTEFTKTLKVRVRDKHAKVLRRQAAAVNRVWNYVNELSHRSIRERNTFLSGYDLQNYRSCGRPVNGYRLDWWKREALDVPRHR